MLGSSIHYATL